MLLCAAQTAPRIFVRAITITIDDSTWCLVEKGSELQVMLALAQDVKWPTLLK